MVYSPQVSLCCGTKSTMLIFSLANGTGSVNRTISTGKPRHGTNSQKCCSIEHPYFSKFEKCMVACFMLLQTGDWYCRELGRKTEDA